MLEGIFSSYCLLIDEDLVFWGFLDLEYVICLTLFFRFSLSYLRILEFILGLLYVGRWGYRGKLDICFVFKEL